MPRPQLRPVKERMVGNANGRLSSVAIPGETFKKARKTKGKGTRPTRLDF
jgi:hypothetical protein